MEGLIDMPLTYKEYIEKMMNYRLPFSALGMDADKFWFAYYL